MSELSKKAAIAVALFEGDAAGEKDFEDALHRDNPQNVVVDTFNSLESASLFFGEKFASHHEILEGVSGNASLLEETRREFGSRFGIITELTISDSFVTVRREPLGILVAVAAQAKGVPAVVRILPDEEGIWGNTLAQKLGLPLVTGSWENVIQALKGEIIAKTKERRRG